jgi:hypothetical protein
VVLADGDGGMSSAATLSIGMTLQNDAPTVNDQSLSIDENSSNGDVVGTVSMTDPDAGDAHTFTITGGTGQTAFAINGSTGEITVADSAQLDHEATTSFTLTVEVADDGSPVKSDTATITIDLNDLNDIAPVVTGGQTFSIAEIASNGDSVGTVVATDVDTVGSLSGWTIVSGNGDGVFAIDGTTGEITIASNANLNYEATNSYVLAVQVGDGVNTSVTETVAISIDDANDTASVVTPSQVFNIAEVASNGDTVGTVLATDVDAVGSLSGWTIASGNGDGIFQINSSTGEITIASNTSLDYETTNSYVLTVQVGDGVNTSATETVAIAIDDANDTAPVVTPTQTFNITEAASNGDSVGSVVATDADTVGSLTGWTITAGNGDGIFQINSTTGEITIASNTNLDYEATSNYVLTVQVGDGVNTSVTETVAISIDDANDTAPVVTPSQTFNITEAASNGDSVGTVVATDADTVGVLGGWTITAGNGDGIFQIDSTTGEITIASNTNLDFETTNSYVLTVEVGDGVNTSVTETVAIAIDDTNDTAPVVTPGQLFSISEAASNGDAVGTALATDADTVGSLTGWTITAGNGDGIFQIDSNTGAITIADSTNLDYETTYSHVLTVRVGDGVTSSAAETVTIAVTNVNEAPSTGGIADRVVVEDAPDVVVDLFGAFADAEDADADMTYTVTANSNPGLFDAAAIDGIAGNLTFDLADDGFGTADLTVRATDGGGQTVETTFRVTVTPVNDAPTFVSNTGLAVNAGQAQTISAGALEVTDVDDAAVDLTYTVASGPAEGTLKLDGIALEDDDQFSQQDIDQGRLSYERSASGATSDEFTVVVSDASGATINAAVSITSQPIVIPVAPDPEPAATATETAAPALPEQSADEPADDQRAGDDVETGTGADDPQEGEASSDDVVIYGAADYHDLFESDESAQVAVALSLDNLPKAETPKVERDGDAAQRVRETARMMHAFASGSSMLAPLQALVSSDALMSQITLVADRLNGRVDPGFGSTSIVFSTAAGLTAAVSAGYTMWAIRGGAMMASVLSALPITSFMDPLPILESGNDKASVRQRPDNDADDAERAVDRILD